MRCRQRATRQTSTSCMAREGTGRVPLLRGSSAALRTRRISRPRRSDVSDDCAHTAPTAAGGLWRGSSRVGSPRELSALSSTGIKVREGFFSTVLTWPQFDLQPPGRPSSDCRLAARLCTRQHLRQAARARCTGARVGTNRHPNVQYVLFPHVGDAFLVLIVSSSQSPTSAAILICAGPEILILSLDRRGCDFSSLFAVSSDFSGTSVRTSIDPDDASPWNIRIRLRQCSCHKRADRTPCAVFTPTMPHSSIYLLQTRARSGSSRPSWSVSSAGSSCESHTLASKLSSGWRLCPEPSSSRNRPSYFPQKAESPRTCRAMP